MHSIKNIIFDLGGVILNIDYQKTQTAFENLGITNFGSLYSQMKQNSLFDDMEEGKISNNNFVNGLKEYLPKNSIADIISAWNAMLLDLPKERLDAIYELKKDYQIFLLSNTNAIHIEAFKEIIEKSIDWKYFSEAFHNIYFSSEIGLRKPNKAVFEFVLNTNKIKAEETLFIDDTPLHLNGAKSLGINTFQHPSNGDLLASLKHLGLT